MFSGGDELTAAEQFRPIGLHLLAEDHQGFALRPQGIDVRFEAVIDHARLLRERRIRRLLEQPNCPQFRRRRVLCRLFVGVDRITQVRASDDPNLVSNGESAGAVVIEHSQGLDTSFDRGQFPGGKARERKPEQNKNAVAAIDACRQTETKKIHEMLP